jgi:hypothetical protein
MTLRSVGALLALLFVASTAAAEQPPAEPYIAKFKEGRALLDANKFAEALEKFQESLKLKEASGTLLNMGDCQEHLGQYASASISFERARSLAADEKKPEREKEARDRANKLEPLISKITVTAPAGAKITVTVDGGPAELGQPVSVDGGTHVVHAEAVCKRPKDFPLSLGMKADLQTMNIDPATFDPDPACTKQEVAPTMSTYRLMAFVAGGVGVVAAGFGVGFGVSAAGKKSDLDTMCPSYPEHCALGQKPALDAKYDSAQTSATISTVMFTTAILFVGGGVALYILSPEWKNSQTAFIPGRWTF